MSYTRFVYKRLTIWSCLLKESMTKLSKNTQIKCKACLRILENKHVFKIKATVSLQIYFTAYTTEYYFHSIIIMQNF